MKVELVRPQALRERAARQHRRPQQIDLWSDGATPSPVPWGRGTG